LPYAYYGRFLQARQGGVSSLRAVWQRFLAWDDFLLGRSAGVYPRRILAGAAANGRRA